MIEAEAWVAVAFVLFLGILVYVGAHRRVIDGSISARRASRPSSRKRAGCGKRRRRCSSNTSASGTTPTVRREAIIATANAEAERLAAEGKARLEDFVARRTKMAETKIAQAEAQALADVRSSAADAAVAAAEKILSTTAKGKIGDDLLARGIADLRKGFN